MIIIMFLYIEINCMILVSKNMRKVRKSLNGTKI